MPHLDPEKVRRPGVWSIVVAGGSGARFGKPKQYEMIGGRRVLDWSVAAAVAASQGVVLVVPADDVARETVTVLGAGADTGVRGVAVVAGGATRSESVRAGLAEVPGEATVVCVHDAARPFASPAQFAAVIDAVLAGADAAVPGVPVTDTVKVVDAQGVVRDTPDRATLVAVQTPQAFRADALREAHASGGEATDDAALVERAGGRVVVVPGSDDNRKITHPEDLDRARELIAARDATAGGDMGEW